MNPSTRAIGVGRFGKLTSYVMVIHPPNSAPILYMGAARKEGNLFLFITDSEDKRKYQG